MEAPPAITIRELSVRYGENLVLDQVSLEVRAGRLTAIVGPNGAGKSTLVKATLGLIPVESGSIDLASEKRPAYVPQRSSVDWDFPTDALDVVMMGLYQELGWFRRPKREHRERAFQALRDVEMDELAHRHISALSGGQQQRVFLARAVVQSADLMLLDEPFAGIDAVTESTLVRLLRAHRDRGRTAVVVHHDLDTVREIFDDVILLNKKVIAAGPVDTVLTRDHLRLAYGIKIGF